MVSEEAIQAVARELAEAIAARDELRDVAQQARFNAASVQADADQLTSSHEWACKKVRQILGME